MNNIFELIYQINKDNTMTQRDMAQKMFLSLGKVNTIIQEAVSLELIDDSKGYVVTKKGLELLEANRVDNAIIMAAGFGSRFVPMTYDKPKGLLEVHGEVMIERQIRQLHEVGIKDISIVVGYLKETFEYLTEKYGVKLIYNPEFSTKNNISSLYYAKDELKNTYILTSDIYMPDNLYREYEFNSFYAVEFFEEETDEWAVKLNKDNLILEASPIGGSNTWAMYGPTFFKKDFSEKLIKAINSVYGNKYAAQWYWEDVYLNNIKEMDLYARKYPSNSILEFESLEELRAYDETYLINARSEILDVISNVFNVGLDDIVRIKTLKEGMTNDSFLFDVKGERYVFRNPGIGTEKLINRAQEAAVYETIKVLDISDEIIYLNPELGYKITKFLPNSRTINIENKHEVEMALEKLRLLHGSNLTVEHEFNLKERIAYYIELATDNKSIFFTDFDEIHAKVQKVILYLESLDREKKLCHVDPVSDNFLLTDGEIHLLDWEYASMADPLMDLAMYVVYSGLQEDAIIELLNMYLQREHTQEELRIVYSYVSLSGFLWSIWTIYKQASGENFGTYGIEQYQYARKYANIVLGEK